MRQINHFINGTQVPSRSGRTIDVFNPASGAVIGQVASGNHEDLEVAVLSARCAQSAWAQMNPQRRARVFMRFVDLVEKEISSLAELLSQEHGKTLVDSKGDIRRGLEVAEFVIGIPHLCKGEFSEGAGRDIDLYSIRQPIGIGAGITPFNFPAMIPMWMFAPAIACGNAFILKPSERNPSVPLHLAELMMDAGLPPGILNVVHGDKGIVDAILRHPAISAVSFVGSTPVAANVYATGADQGKRMQAFGGAKNHAVVMPDADIDLAADALIGAAYGSAGERCMAISVVVPVGASTAENLVAALKTKLETLTVGPYTNGTTDFGPVISREALDRIRTYIDLGVREGATLVLDGRKTNFQGDAQGFYIGPTLFDNVVGDMEIYRKEIFGPVLCVARTHSYADALSLTNGHEYGNGGSIFTNSGETARDFVSRVQTGMVGVNVPIPAPLAYHSFGGWKRSSFGDLNQHGPDAVRFWTRTKTITSRWPSGATSLRDFSMPTFHDDAKDNEKTHREG